MRDGDPRGVGVKGGRGEILAIAFFMGLAAAVSQAVIIRELLSVCRGNELIIGVMLASWFAGVFAGARANTGAGRAALRRRVTASLLILPVMMALAVYGARAAAIAVPRGPGAFFALPAEMLIAFVFTAPAGFAVGFFFPPLVALLAGEEGDRAGGTVYYVESIGSCAGGAAFSFVLVEIANPLALASSLASVSLVFILMRARWKLLPLAAIPLVLAVFSAPAERALFSAIWGAGHPGTLEDYRRTRYQTLSRERYGDTVSVYGDGALMYTLPDRYEARGPFHLVNALRGRRARILLMGSGPGSLLHNLLGTDAARVSYFEPDPALWDFMAPVRRGLYPDDGRCRKLTVRRSDLRRALTVESERYDMIVSLPPAPTSIMLNRFYTREFFSLCRMRLAPGGVFVTSLSGFSNYLSADLRGFIGTVYRAFTAEFPFRLVTSGETVYLIGAAGPGAIPDDADALVTRYARALPLPAGSVEPEAADNYSPDELRMFFERTQLASFHAAMRAAAAVENRDLAPEAYWKNILLAAFREGSFLHALLRGLVAAPLLLLLVSAAALLDVRRRHGGRLFAGGLIIYLTGLAGISSMIVMLLIYQNARGMVYYRIALINALFMLGLAAGAYARSRMHAPTALIFAGIAGSLGLVLLQTFFASEALYWATLALFSFFCGAVFPALFAACGGNSLAAASVLDAMDHFGAIVGALLTVMLLIPLLGLRGTLVFNMAAVFAAWAAARAAARPGKYQG